ncbi:MAG: hypothetical protein ACO4CG_08325 [Prochlorothrix sp.]|nr:hypothetical protein [Prochlorothrix sp.]
MASASPSPSFQIRQTRSSGGRSTLQQVQMPTLPPRLAVQAPSPVTTPSAAASFAVATPVARPKSQEEISPRLQLPTMAGPGSADPTPGQPDPMQPPEIAAFEAWDMELEASSSAKSVGKDDQGCPPQVGLDGDQENLPGTAGKDQAWGSSGPKRPDLAELDLMGPDLATPDLTRPDLTRPDLPAPNLSASDLPASNLSSSVSGPQELSGPASPNAAGQSPNNPVTPAPAKPAPTTTTSATTASATINPATIAEAKAQPAPKTPKSKSSQSKSRKSLAATLARVEMPKIPTPPVYQTEATAAGAVTPDRSGVSTANAVRAASAARAANTMGAAPGANSSYATITVQPFTVAADAFQQPSLPKVKTPGFTQHRHSSNPCFAMSLLQDIAVVVQQWQLELEEVHNQIQAIYMEGPIVDGWLEADTATDGSVTGYRLCGLNQNGQLWSRPCPPDQLAGLSVAIARYQTLRQTIAQKHRLEVRLKQLGETLAVLRSRI